MTEVWTITPSETEETDVVGESHYRAELAALVGTVRERFFTASLIPEPDNPYDSKAVGVYQADGPKIGHLSREDAASWQPLLLDIQRAFEAVVTCEAIAGGRIGGPIGVTLRIGLDDVKRELGRRRPSTPAAPVASVPLPSWRVRRDEQEYPAQDLDQLRAWARDGNLLPTDYIFNVVLGCWMYAKDTAELAPIFAARQANEQTSRGTSKTGIGLLIGGLIIGWVVWWPVGIFTAVIGVIVILAHAASRPSRTTASDGHRPESLPGASPVAKGRRASGRLAAVVVTVALLIAAPIIFFNRTSEAPEHRAAPAARQNLTKPVEKIDAPTQPDTLITETTVDPVPSDKWGIDSPSQQAVEATDSPVTMTVPIRRIAEQVWVHEGMYYGENCEKPAGATRLPKAIAIRQGNRPAPSCYSHK